MPRDDAVRVVNAILRYTQDVAKRKTSYDTKLKEVAAQTKVFPPCPTCKQDHSVIRSGRTF